MQKIHATAFDPNTGQARAGASILVTISATGVAAALFSDDETTPLANPLTADSAGRASFKVADGEYDLRVSGSGFTTYTYTLVQVADSGSFAAASHTHALPVHTHEDASQGGALDAHATQSGQFVLDRIPISSIIPYDTLARNF